AMWRPLPGPELRSLRSNYDRRPHPRRCNVRFAAMRFIAFRPSYCKYSVGCVPTFRGEETMRKIEVAGLVGLLLSGLAIGPTAATAQEVTLRVHSVLPAVANPMKHYVT